VYLCWQSETTLNFRVSILDRAVSSHHIMWLINKPPSECSVGFFHVHLMQFKLDKFIYYAPSANSRRRSHFVFWSSVRLSVCCSSVNAFFRMTLYLFTYWRDFNDIYHKYSSCEWKFLKKFSRSAVKGQGHMCTQGKYWIEYLYLLLATPPYIPIWPLLIAL